LARLSRALVGADRPHEKLGVHTRTAAVAAVRDR
jgi:hypothetical protein